MTALLLVSLAIAQSAEPVAVEGAWEVADEIAGEVGPYTPIDLKEAASLGTAWTSAATVWFRHPLEVPEQWHDRPLAVSLATRGQTTVFADGAPLAPVDAPETIRVGSGLHVFALPTEPGVLTVRVEITPSVAPYAHNRLDPHSVHVGPADALGTIVRSRHQAENLQDALPLLMMAGLMSLVTLFLAFFYVRTNERAFGWYAATLLAGVGWLAASLYDLFAMPTLLRSLSLQLTTAHLAYGASLVFHWSFLRGGTMNAPFRASLAGVLVCAAAFAIVPDLATQVLGSPVHELVALSAALLIAWLVFVESWRGSRRARIILVATVPSVLVNGGVLLSQTSELLPGVPSWVIAVSNLVMIGAMMVALVDHFQPTQAAGDAATPPELGGPAQVAGPTDSRVTDQRITRWMPYPIAYAWRAVGFASSDAIRVDASLQTVEVMLRTLATIQLADYLAGPPAPTVEGLLEARLRRPSMGTWLELNRELARALRSRANCFCPEAHHSLLDRRGKPTQTLDELGELVALRNQVAHRGPMPSERRARELAQQALPKVRALLESMIWLTGYRLFRVTAQRPTRERTSDGRLQYYIGSDAQTEAAPASWDAHLLDGVVYCVAPSGKDVLEVAPFAAVLDAPGAPIELLHLFAGIDRRGRVELRAALVEHEAAVEPEGANGACTWADWLTERENRQPWQPNVGTLAASALFGGAETGSVLGNRFELRGLLGTGGMSTVHRAWDRLHDTEVALKLLIDDFSTVADFRERFRREAQKMRSIPHPSVLSDVELGQLEDGRLFLRMPVLSGGSLRDRIEAGPVTTEQAERWARQLLGALAALHRAGVVHRDIKPGNLLLDEDDRLVVVDFGIALDVDDTRLTRTLQQMGSIAYLAPEARAGEAEHASDIYSAALVLHELVRGALPRGPAGGDIRGTLGEAIRAMGQADPDLRPSATEGLAILDGELTAPTGVGSAGGPSRPTRQPNVMETLPETSAHPRRWGMVAAATLAVGAVIGSGIALTVFFEEPAPQGVLRIASLRPRTNLDPYNPGRSMFDDAEGAVLESLMTMGPDGQPRPLALASVHRPDPLHVDLTLRPGAWFHPHPCVGPDGRAADAEDLQFSLEEAARRDRLALEGIGFEAEEQTLRLTLPAPHVFLENELSDVQLLPRELGDCPSERLDDLTQPVGTGPFRFSGPAGPTSLSLVSHPRYGRVDDIGNPLPRLAALEFSHVRPPDLVQAAIDGSVDVGEFSGQIDTPEVRKQLERSGLALWTAAPPATRVVRVLLFLPRSATAPPLDVRRVILEALDREEVVAVHVFAEHFEPLQRWLGPHQLGYDPRGVARGNPDELRSRVAASGHVSPIVIGAFGSDEGTIEQIQSQLAEVGLQVEASRLSGASLAAALEQHLVDAVVVQQAVPTWGAESYPYLQAIVASIGTVGVEMPDAWSALEAAKTSGSTKDRSKHYQDVEGALLTSVPAVPIAIAREAQPTPYLVAPGVQLGAASTGIDYARVRIEP